MENTIPWNNQPAFVGGPGLGPTADADGNQSGMSSDHFSKSSSRVISLFTDASKVTIWWCLVHLQTMLESLVDI